MQFNLSDLKDKNHPAWALIRFGAIVAVTVLCMNFYYAHGYDPIKDTALLGTMFAAFGGVTALKSFICHGDFEDCNHDDKPQS